MLAAGMHRAAGLRACSPGPLGVEFQSPFVRHLKPLPTVRLLQVARKLAEAQRELQTAEAAGASAEQAVHSRERHKKWLKF